MSKGIIYVMTTAVPGLVKIGKTMSDNFEKRMYNLEHNGYCNVTALKRVFAIEVEDYDEKEKLLHTIFEKSQLADTELFSVDENIVIQLLSSFDGCMIYPKDETKSSVFIEAAENNSAKVIPDGIYKLSKFRRTDNRNIEATAIIENGYWTIKKGSVFSVKEGTGGSNKLKELRKTLPLDESGLLLDDIKLGECSPSFAASVVINGAADGWREWKNSKEEFVDIYRKRENEGFF